MRVFTLPDLGEGIHEGEIIEVQVAPGDVIAEGQPLLVVETDKAAVEIPSPYTGKVTAVHIHPHDVIHVGDSLVEFTTEEGPQTPVPSVSSPLEAEELQKTAVPGRKKGGKVPASPATRRLARELGLALEDIKGTGPAGRVLSEDVQAFAKRPGDTVSSEKVVGIEERIPLRSVRRVIAKQMALSWQQIPHVTHMDEADITHLEEERQKYKHQIGEQGGILTLTTFALKAAVMALKAFPSFNAELDIEREEIICKQYYHIGVATDTDRGLVVPVIRDVDKKSLSHLAIELPELARKTREAKLSLDEVKGGTFTLTNIGSLGGTGFSPIINFPQTSILGLGQARWKAVVRKSEEMGFEIIPRLVLPLILGFDHRVVDGAEGARFLNLVKDVLEDPVAMLFQKGE